MKVLESRSMPCEASSEVEALLETIQSEGAQRRSLNRSVKLTIAGMVALVVIGGLVDMSKGKPFDFTSMIILASCLGGGCAYGLTPKLRKAVTRATELADLRLLGGMIEALDSGEPNLRATLEEAATPLLAQVTSDDLGLLNDGQLDRLLRAVRLSKNKRFCKAAMSAAGRIGSQRTLQNLEILVNDPSLPHHRRYELEPHIRAAMGELRLRLAGELLSGGTHRSLQTGDS